MHLTINTVFMGNIAKVYKISYSPKAAVFH